MPAECRIAHQTEALGEGCLISSATAEARKIFTVAIEPYSPEQWSSYLDEVCGEHSEIRKRVEFLLEAHMGEESLLDIPAIASPPTLDQAFTEYPITEKLGAQIGPSKLPQQIGEGGFSIVFVAGPTHPVRRKAALKILLFLGTSDDLKTSPSSTLVACDTHWLLCSRACAG